MTMIGKAYAIAPQPPVPENTHWFDAGNVTIGIEYRDVDPEGLFETYHVDQAQLAELLDRSPEGGFSDEGVSIHVKGTDDDHEYLRFDVFDAEPHYHYNHPGEQIVNNVIEFDTVAHGDMLPWALARILSRLGEMLHEAGGGRLVAELDMSAVDRAVDQVAAQAKRAIAAVRAARSARS
jgi:hypothetical protein